MQSAAAENLTMDSRLITTERILHGMRLDIVSGKYAVGAKVVENDIGERYGASRGSVRAALQVLEGEGLVRVLPNGRKEVVGFTTKQARDLYDLRWIIENRALEIVIRDRSLNLSPMVEALREIESAQRGNEDGTDWYTLDIQFHRALVMASDNQALLSAWAVNIPVMRVLMQLYRIQDQKGYTEGMYAQHMSLFESAVTGNGDAFPVLRRHIMDACPHH